MMHDTNFDELKGKLAEMDKRAGAENWSPLRHDLELRRAMWGGRDGGMIDFMLTHGRDYRMGPDSFAGPRDEVHMCFMNATWRAINYPTLTYVEGYVSTHGVPIEHAWCVDANGVVVDPTLEPNTDGRILGYFGVPFETEYLRKATFKNKVYGLLGWKSRKTLPKLLELGLEEGQRWLLEKRKRQSKRKGRS